MHQYHPEWANEGTTSGSRLRFIRESRKMTIEELSSLSGVPTKVIEDVENNSVKFTIEQVEKIAIAAECHPSFIAFPYWEAPHKPEKILVKGQFLINGSLECSEFHVFLAPDLWLWISSGNRKSLKIHTFNNSMSYGPLGSKKSNEKNYSLTGDALGGFHDNYSNGSEPDCDSRAIKQLDIKISIDKTGFGYSFKGLAVVEDGYVKPRRPKDSPPGDWTFDINFIVGVDQIQNFFGLTPAGEKYFLQRLPKN